MLWFKRKTYRYFIAFTYHQKDVPFPLHGNAEVRLNRVISNINDIVDALNQIKETLPDKELEKSHFFVSWYKQLN